MAEPTEAQKAKARELLLKFGLSGIANALADDIAQALADEAEQAVASKKTAAEALADEVDALVRRRVIDSRSPAADALLDYRNPPMSPRSDRLVAMDEAVAKEREACAKIVDGCKVYNSPEGFEKNEVEQVLCELAADIRARAKAAK